MVAFIPAPDHRTLLPPLLACLPVAFASPLPPPVLLPLLSPILRQRVQLLSSVSPSSSSDSWLRLLCWDPAKAERLERIVGSTTFEPHPVSGEIEIPDDIPIAYKRFDQETLRSRLSLEEYDIAVVYLWCPDGQEGAGPDWRVTEVVPLDCLREDDDSWLGSIGEANEHSQERMVKEALKEAEETANGTTEEHREEEAEVDDDDDDYWAQYDNTPGGQTPAQKPPAPRVAHGALQPATDDSYFGRYADVQPALDNDDPSANREEVGESTLNGDAVNQLLRRHAESIGEQQRLEALGMTRNDMSHAGTETPLNQPRASSPSSGSVSISKLEQTAETQSAAEAGVKQHISSNIRSLFRLARTTGISKSEFDSIVRGELETLDLMPMDDN